VFYPEYPTDLAFGNIKLQHRKSENMTDVKTPGQNAGTRGSDAGTSG
jgi:hypothetical protein